eukprot:scaffold10163_cov35-Tisochrysis_lutea.AAC.1
MAALSLATVNHSPQRKRAIALARPCVLWHAVLAPSRMHGRPCWPSRQSEWWGGRGRERGREMHRTREAAKEMALPLLFMHVRGVGGGGGVGIEITCRQHCGIGVHQSIPSVACSRLFWFAAV